MSKVTLLQGAALANFFAIDLAEAGLIDAVKIEVGLNGATVLDYRYPSTEGYPVITKTDNSYSIDLTSAQTAAMRGTYEIEVTASLSGTVVLKANVSQSGDIYLEIVSEIK